MRKPLVPEKATEGAEKRRNRFQVPRKMKQWYQGISGTGLPDKKLGKRCTVLPPGTLTQKHGLTFAEYFPQCVRKAGPDVDFYYVSTYQCSIPLQQHGFHSTERVNFGKLRMLLSRFLQMKKFHVTSDPRLSTPQRILGKQLRICDLDGRGWTSLPTDANKLLSNCGFSGGHHSNKSNALSVAKQKKDGWTVRARTLHKRVQGVNDEKPPCPERTLKNAVAGSRVSRSSSEVLPDGTRS